MNPAGKVACYQYCDLIIRSQLVLPGLPVVADALAYDIDVQVAPVPETLPGARQFSPLVSLAGTEALWQFAPIGRFHIQNRGCVIAVAPAQAASADAVVAFLLQPVFALALMFRGEFLLSAASVSDGQNVIAFTGGPAVGKSVVVAAMRQKGFRLVSDSLLRITVSETGVPMAHPQAPWQQLWPDALEKLHVEGAQSVIRPELSVRNVASSLETRALPLKRLLLLRSQDGSVGSGEISLSAVDAGVEKLKCIRGNTAASDWLEAFAGNEGIPARWLLALVAKVKLDRLSIPWDWSTVSNESAHKLVEALELEA